MLEELGLSEKVLVFPLFPNYFSFSIPVVVDNWNVQTCIVVGYQLLCHLRNFFSIIFKNTSSDSFNQDRDLVQSEDLEAQMVKNPPATRETWVRSLGQEDPLEKGMATHSSILAWRIPWTEKRDGLQSMGSPRVRYNWAEIITEAQRGKDRLHFLSAALLSASHCSPGEWLVRGLLVAVEGCRCTSIRSCDAAYPSRTGECWHQMGQLCSNVFSVCVREEKKISAWGRMTKANPAPDNLQC